MDKEKTTLFGRSLRVQKHTIDFVLKRERLYHAKLMIVSPDETSFGRNGIFLCESSKNGKLMYVKKRQASMPTTSALAEILPCGRL